MTMISSIDSKCFFIRNLKIVDGLMKQVLHEINRKEWETTLVVLTIRYSVPLASQAASSTPVRNVVAGWDDDAVRNRAARRSLHLVPDFHWRKVIWELLAMGRGSPEEKRIRSRELRKRRKAAKNSLFIAWGREESVFLFVT
jgi:hypothetical protein